MQRDLVQHAIALVRFKLDHGDYPRRLDQLVPEYVLELANDRFTGTQLTYKRNGPDFLLYSVGPDGIDNKGLGFMESATLFEYDVRICSGDPPKP